MAKKKSLFDFQIPKIEMPNLSTSAFASPSIQEEVLKNFKPLSEQLKEALEPVYEELARVTTELGKANNRAEKAEEQAQIAEVKADRYNRRSYWLSFIAFIIPFSYAVWSDLRNQLEKKESEKMQSTLQSLSREVQSLKADISKAKKPLLPAKGPSRSIEGLNSKNP